MSLYFERAGSGQPLLLIHGLGGTSLVWKPVRERLEAERDVIAVDLPGFGRSPALGDGKPTTAATMAATVAALCSDLGVARPHVAGNSLGAWVGLEMAKAGEVRSVCCISPAGLWRNPLGPRRVDRQRLGRVLLPLLRPILATRGGRARLLSTSVADPERIPADDARALVLGYIDSGGYEAANEAMRAGAFEHEGLVNVPVTIVWGEEDQIVGRPSPSRIPPGSEYSAAPGWGHTPTWDDPAGVAELLLRASRPEPEGL